MDKKERYVFVYNSYDVDEFVYDNKDRLRIDSLNKCCNVLNWKEDKIAKLEAELAEKEKFFERIMSGEYIPANIAEKSLKLSNQTAIDILQEVKDWIGDFSELRGYEWNRTLKYLNDKIKSLKGEK